jgi:hypothetical protein
VGKQTHEIMIPRLSLLNWRVKTDHKESLPSILMGEQENPQNGVHSDLVIERLSVKLEERGKHLDVVSTSVNKIL